MERRLTVAADERRLSAPVVVVAVAVAKVSIPTAAVAVVTADETEEAVVSTAVLEAGAQLFDSDAPQWPDDAAETAFLSEQKTIGEPLAPKPLHGAGGSAVEDTDGGDVLLPGLDSLVNRIPAEARDVLDELFRARFVSVKRVQKSALK